MLQTIEVEIDTKGHIHPLEKMPLPLDGKSRALLTILPAFPAVRRQTGTAQETPAFGVLTASRSVSIEEMETAIIQGAASCDCCRYQRTHQDFG